MEAHQAADGTLLRTEKWFDAKSDINDWKNRDREDHGFNEDFSRLVGGMWILGIRDIFVTLFSFSPPLGLSISLGRCLKTFRNQNHCKVLLFVMRDPLCCGSAPMVVMMSSTPGSKQKWGNIITGWYALSLIVNHAAYFYRREDTPSGIQSMPVAGEGGGG